MWGMLATLAQQGSGLEQLGADFSRKASTLPPPAGGPTFTNPPAFPAASQVIDTAVQPVFQTAQNAAQTLPAVPGTGAAPLPPEAQNELTRQLVEAQKQLNATYGTWTKSITDFISTQGVAFAIKLCAAVLLFYVGKWVARMFTNFVSHVMEKAGADPMLVRFSANVLYFACLVMISIGALDVLGVPMGSATAVIAAGGFAIGLALQGSLSNFAAGIMLIVFKPFKVGDDIEAGGTSGNVEEINIFNTVLKSGGNVQIIVPNGTITSGVIKNNSAFPSRKIELSIGCSYGDDLKAVKAFLEKLVAEDKRILREPAPTVVVSSLAESGVMFSVCPWVKSSEHGKVRSDLIERIKLGFDERGFTIPFPSRDLYVHTANVLPMAKAG